MKRKLLVISMFVICLAAVIGYFIIDYKNKSTDLEKEVVLYVQAKYPDTTLKNISSGYSLKGKGYYVDVIYNDEPNIRYTYMKIDNKITLNGTTNPEGKHMDPSFGK